MASSRVILTRPDSMTFMPTLMAQFMPMTPQTIDRQVQNLVLEQRPAPVENVGDSEWDAERWRGRGLRQ